MEFVKSSLEVDKTEVAAAGAMATAMQPLAAELGARVLARGGNAVDAAVAIGFALAVVEPFMSGPLGHGAMVVRPAGGDAEVLDFTTRAPHAATPDMYRAVGRGEAPGRFPAVEDRANAVGHRAVPVPTAAFGLLAAHERYGRLPREALLEPAAALARDGVEVDWYASLMIGSHMAKLLPFRASRESYLLEGRRPPAPQLGSERPGERLEQRHLAASLRMLASEGEAPLRRGILGERLVEELHRGGGVLSERDLQAYQPRWSRGSRLPFRDVEIIGVPAPSGSSALFQMLNLIEGLPVPAAGSEAFYHQLAEVQRLAFLERFETMGDPDMVPVSEAEVVSKERAAELRGRIGERAGGAAAPELPPGDDCTTHFNVVDEQRMMVSATVTLCQPLGSGVVVPGTGLLTSNIMAQFDPRPGRPNSIAPWKRPLWNGSPLLVTRGGEPLLALGAPGSRRIISCLLQVLVLILDHGFGVQQAISFPRVHCEGSETLIDGRVPAAVREGLARRGHRLVPVEESYSAVHFARPGAVLVDADRGLLRAGVDQWRVGACVGF